MLDLQGKWLKNIPNPYIWDQVIRRFGPVEARSNCHQNWTFDHCWMFAAS